MPTAPAQPEELLYDWNLVGAPIRPTRPIEIDDETLRDGLQSPSVRTPSVEEKIEILHAIADIGVRFADLGYPGAGERSLNDVVGLAAEIGREGLPIEANCAGRTVPADIRPIAEAQQRSGVPIEASIYLGSSPIRQYVEGWDLDFLVRTTHEAVTLAKSLNLEVMFVTEDTTRAEPADLARIYNTAIEAGARRICFSDTVGHATPWGVQSLISFGRELVDRQGEDVKIDYHGHRDRGLDVVNSITALASGADRVHGCALGIGERIGNTSMEVLLINLRLLGWVDNDLSGLSAYCEAVSRATRVAIPRDCPGIGNDAFETSTGVHAAAVLKALQKGDTWLANRVYSGVPADMVGREQVITVGPMSGQANATAWLTQRELPVDPDTVERILAVAKDSDRVLTDEEIFTLVASS
ncbi:MAG TPA: LeuA family protein [Acidimicrobiia bacterium]|nr:LeuA family protein [Acidimicrobiia bacterium]